MADITGPISSASQIDELQWSLVSDQFGVTNPDTNVTYIDLTVNTLNGTTYVAGVQENGDVDLWNYDVDTKAFTLLASHEGRGSSASDAFLNMTDPQILEIDGKIAIVGATQSKYLTAVTYDPALGEATSDDDGRLVYESNFNLANNFYGSGNDETFQFTSSTGENYFLTTSAAGSFDGGQLSYDVNGDLSLNHMVVSSNKFTSDGPDDAHVLVSEERMTTHEERFMSADSVTSVDYVQVGDSVFEYVTSGSGGGSFHVIRWDVDTTTGELSGSQVLYTDGTTLKDMQDAGYPSQPYPTESPFTTGALPLNSAGFPGGQYLNQVAQDSGYISALDDGSDNAIDAIDFKDTRAVQTFEVNGETYMFVGTWASQQDGAAIFKIDATTGLPSQLIDIVEGEGSGTADSDDAVFAFQGTFNDVHAVSVDASGEVVIAVNASQDSLVYFKFDPNGSFGSGDTVNTGALTYIGAEGGDQFDAYNLDTSGTDYLGFGGADGNDSGLLSTAVLPDGTMLVGTRDGLMHADAGVTDLNGGTFTTVVVCFVAGSLIETVDGSVKVESLKVGDLVKTLDNGNQPIRWIGSQTISRKNLTDSPHLLPIRIKKGALGGDCPASDLYVSPQHRILVRSVIANRMFGETEVLVPAKKLLEIDGVDVVEDCDEVTYYHMLFENHEIVFANGAEAESLLTGPEALKAVKAEDRDVILEIFPEIGREEFMPKAVRTIPPMKLVKKLVARHVNNAKPLVQFA